MNDHIAQVIGYTTMAAAGGTLAAFVAIVAWSVTGYVGVKVFTRLRRIYHLRVIQYWLIRLEKGGVSVFEKAERGTHDFTTPTDLT